MATTTAQPARQPFLQKVRQRFESSARSFFFAPDGQESDDHLVEVVRRNPAMATWFLELTSLFSIVGSLVAALACGVFLSYHWSRCGSCGRPLRWWLVGQVCLQMSQIPARVVLYASIRKVSGAWTVEALMLSLTASPAWRLSKMVSLVLYGWFVLGAVWWMHNSDCEDCPGITVLLSAVLALTAARMAVTLLASHELFPQPEPVAQAPAAPKIQPATPCQIRALPLIRVRTAQRLVGSSDALHERRVGICQSFSSCTAGENCAVCLNDFFEGEWARRLPCLHHFHPPCIDRWLLQNKRCPLCMHPIDKVCMPPRLKQS